MKMLTFMRKNIELNYLQSILQVFTVHPNSLPQDRKKKLFPNCHDRSEKQTISIWSWSGFQISIPALDLPAVADPTRMCTRWQPGLTATLVSLLKAAKERGKTVFHPKTTFHLIFITSEAGKSGRKKWAHVCLCVCVENVFILQVTAVFLGDIKTVNRLKAPFLIYISYLVTHKYFYIPAGLHNRSFGGKLYGGKGFFFSLPHWF